MNKRIIILFIMLIPLVSATRLPFGVEGMVYDSGMNPVVAKVSITNLNNSFNVSGMSNIGKIGRYSASIKGSRGDFIEVEAEYQGLFYKKIFSLEGLHKEDLIIGDLEKKSESSVKKTKSPSLVIVSIENVLTSKQEVNIKTKTQDFGWRDLEDFPDNKFSILLYEEAEMTVVADGKVYTKKIVPDKETKVVKLTLINDLKLSMLIIGSLVIFVIFLLLVKKK